MAQIPQSSENGIDFAKQLLYIKWSNGDYYGAKDAWVSQCPDDIEPRSLDNPFVFTYEQTLQSDWGTGQNETWYIVGAIEYWWLATDYDIGNDHAETVEFEIEDIQVPAEGTLVALTPSGGAHAYILLENEPPEVTTNYAGIDLLSDSSNVRLAGAISPWHDEARRVLSDPEIVTQDYLFDDYETYDHVFSIEGYDEPVLVERNTEDVIVDLEIPDEAPDGVPTCIGDLLMIRSTNARYNYPDSPFAVDTHLGMMLCAVGYSIDDAIELLREYPPAKNTGFDEATTRYQLNMIYEKMLSGDMHPPTKKLIEAGVDVPSCNCAIHGSSGREGDSFALPYALSNHTARRDHRALQAAKNDVRRTMSQPIDGGLIYHAPQGLGKTRFTPFGAREQPRLVITTNKGPHRDTLRHFADQAGVSYADVIPFSDSWLCSDDSPVADECMDLYKSGVMPKYITSEYGDLIPEDVECPYLAQFGESPPSVDLLLGSPGHEHVSTFRKCSIPDEEDPIPRAIIYDDVNPADHEINKNTFELDTARSGLNELIQEIPELESNSVAELRRNRQDIDAVERIALSTDSAMADEENEPDNAQDVWDVLDAAATADDAIRVDIVDIVRRRENVRGETIVQLKVIADANMHNVRMFSWQRNNKKYFSWVSHPKLKDHDVAVLSATHIPHVTETWIGHANAGPAIQKSATDDWTAVRRAQGYLLLQTRSARNSRSGAGAYHTDQVARANYMQDSRDELIKAIETAEGEKPGIIDSKRLIDTSPRDALNFGLIWSNNTLREMEIGLVAGATYFGDEWVESRAAYCGVDIDIIHEPGTKAYCENDVGQDLIYYMTHTWVEQACTRFGRNDDIDEVRVYVDTDSIPKGFPTIDISDQIVRITDSQQEVFEAVADDAITIEEITDRVSVGRRQVGNIVRQLEKLGIVDVDRLSLENGKHRINLYGNSVISLNTVKLPEITYRPAELHTNINAPRLELHQTVQTSVLNYDTPPD